jgi:hypothetical protein
MVEENDDTSSADPNPDFWEVGVFDNTGDMADATVRNATGYADNQLILYATFSSITKASTRKFQVNIRLPFA